MRKVFKDKNTLKGCHIYQMLRAYSHGRHLSFHTPGHKVGKWDITELSYSDNLSAPSGCIAQAEQDIARILGAERSFILTDGSTSGVLAMLYAAKQLGVKTVAVCEASHKSVFNGCSLLGLTPLTYPQKTEKGIPVAYTGAELFERFSALFSACDCVFLTSPDYYGNFADFRKIRQFCDEQGKLLLVDGAHGGHLHFEKSVYAGSYADFWVDGVHKNLPAFTQGAVVSAKTQKYAEKLREGVDIFRTTSPSYPIMASVEYAVKYPRNSELEQAVSDWVAREHRLQSGGDWTKVCAVFGKNAFEAEKILESEGIYPEFCDGNVIMFYLSPATSKKQFKTLQKKLRKVILRFIINNIGDHVCDEHSKNVKEGVQVRVDNCITQCNPASVISQKTEWIALENTENQICAANCGLFPPCTPLIKAGERVKKEKIELLQHANNVYGLDNGKMLVIKTEKEE